MTNVTQKYNMQHQMKDKFNSQENTQSKLIVLHNVLLNSLWNVDNEVSILI